MGGSSLNDGKTSTLHATGNINLMSIYSSKVTLIGINFINGNFKGNGGALSIIESDVTLINCTFECNKASDKGGALYSINSNKVVLIIVLSSITMQILLGLHILFLQRIF